MERHSSAGRDATLNANRLRSPVTSALGSLLRGLIAVYIVCGAASTLAAQSSGIQMPLGDPRMPIVIKAPTGETWRQGDYEVWLLRECRIEQGNLTAYGGEAVIWIDRAEAYGAEPSKVLVYLEPGANNRIEVANAGPNGRSSRLVDRTWFGRLHTVDEIRLRVPQAKRRAEPADAAPLYDRGIRAGPFRDLVAPVQFQEEIQDTGENRIQLGGRAITLRGRGNNRPDIILRNNPERNESAFLIPGGVHLVLDDVYADNVNGVGAVALGKIDIEADSVVIWSVDLKQAELFGGENQPLGEDIPLDLYLEGNIVFRQGDTVIYADRMYYNVNSSYGVVLDAEMLTPVPQYEGLMRLKADVLQQVNRENFVAQNAAITSSRMGVPQYWLQSNRLDIRDQRTPSVDPFTGQMEVDEFGQPVVDHEFLATSSNNFVYVGGVPVLYWPTLATDLKRPNFYLDGLKIKNDNIFGTQVYADWDIYQLLGIRQPPEGTKWTLSTDYLSDRGPALGTNYEYQGFQLLNHPGPYKGMFDAWVIRDQGLDSLGADRLAVPFEDETRGRGLWQHRHDLGGGLEFTGEFGLISDRNFLEQYLENEWDQFKDQTTGIELKKYWDSNTLSLTTDARVNDFFTQTEWLPRADHFLLGQSWFERFTWYAHTHVGYGKLENATLPPLGTEPTPDSPPWEEDDLDMRFDKREGLRAATRQEIDLPLQLGPIKLTPYVLGEAAYWEEDRNAMEVSRLYGQAGIRSSMPIWRSDASVQSTLWNLDGLAHKIVLESELLYADADEDLDRFALYDPLDDDAQEHFIRRFIGSNYAGELPAKYDHRFFALRSGMQSWVSAPTPEIADDLMLYRMAARQRWQTKRGLPGQQRLVDWVTLDVEATLFPRSSRDNFGEDIGLIDYDFRWHLGDRVTFLSDGFVDIFDQGLRTVTVGGMYSRPERGSLYLGFRSIEGPITSNVLTASLSYRMTEKWIARATTSFDFGPTGNIGQRVSLIRIGESALVRVGFNLDEGRDSIGVVLAIEPRFLPQSRLGRVGGVQVPPAGARGLE